jgi:competence ComEA-like helix-hairpin-helix protein
MDVGKHAVQTTVTKGGEFNAGVVSMAKPPISRIRMVLVALLVVLAALLWGSPCGYSSQNAKKESEDPDWSLLLPEGEGKSLVATSCSGCHDLGQVINQAKTAPRWSATVKKMIAANQAPIDERDIPQIVDYLSKSFGEDNPIDQLPLDINACRVEAFGRLPGIGPELGKAIGQNRKESGRFASITDLLRVKGMDASKLDKIKQFIAVN